MGKEGATWVLGAQEPSVDDIEQQHEDHVEEEEATQTRGGLDWERGLAPNQDHSLQDGLQPLGGAPEEIRGRAQVSLGREDRADGQGQITEVSNIKPRTGLPTLPSQTRTTARAITDMQDMQDREGEQGRRSKGWDQDTCFL